MYRKWWDCHANIDDSDEFYYKGSISQETNVAPSTFAGLHITSSLTSGHTNWDSGNWSPALSGQHPVDHP